MDDTVPVPSHFFLTGHYSMGKQGDKNVDEDKMFCQRLGVKSLLCCRQLPYTYFNST